MSLSFIQHSVIIQYFEKFPQKKVEDKEYPLCAGELGELSGQYYDGECLSKYQLSLQDSVSFSAENYLKLPITCFAEQEES